jgi:hypothetical protein
MQTQHPAWNIRQQRREKLEQKSETAGAHLKMK